MVAADAEVAARYPLNRPMRPTDLLTDAVLGAIVDAVADVLTRRPSRSPSGAGSCPWCGAPDEGARL
jgi:hypothetical protein